MVSGDLPDDAIEKPSAPPESPVTPSEPLLDLFRVETTFSGRTLTNRNESLSREAPPLDSLTKTVSKEIDDTGCWARSSRATISPEFSAAGLQSQLFQTLHDQRNVFLQRNNFAKETDIDILRVSCGEGVFLPSQNTRQVDAAINALSTETCGCPRLLVLFIKLEKSKESAFNQKVSISLEQAETIFSQFDIHGGFMGDLIGRPDYWSAINRCKSEGDKVDDVFEFFCQHPRWAQSSRYEKGLPHALQGHRAPCSVYMHHSKARNLTLYMIAASEAEDWFPSLRQRIGINTDSPDRIPQQVSTALALSPFMIHAIMSVIAFEQSIDYVASVRDKLMTQIKHVNDYSTDKGPHNTKLRRSEMEGRIRLENITKELHLVSQTADSGIAGSHMSIKIAEKMLEAHSMHIMPTTTKEPRQQESPAAAAAFIRDTHGMLQYVRDSFYSQKDWLTSYKARKDTAMNFVFNMVTQQDSATNVDISYKMSNDSSSMNAVTILTLIFLPGTFLSTVFSSVAFSTSDSGAAQTTEWLLPFVIAGAILTLFCLSVWYFRNRLAVWRQYISSKANKAFLKAKAGGVVGEMV